MTSRLAPLASRSRRPRVPQLIAVVLFAWSGLTAERAVAQPAAALNLRWQAPQSCPQQEEVKERIRKLVGTARVTATALQAEGTITQTGGAHFHLKLVTRSGSLVGERNLDAASCEDLAGAAAVSLALLMRSAEPLSADDLGEKQALGVATGGALGSGGEPSSGAPSASAPSASAPSTSAPSTSAPQQTKPASAAAEKRKPVVPPPAKASNESDAPDDEPLERPLRPSPRTWRFLVQAPLASMSFGPLPAPSWGVALAGGAAFENWRLLLGGTAWLRQNVGSEPFPEYGADVDRLTGMFKACHALGDLRFEVAPCLVLSVEHIWARGTGPDVMASSSQTTWVAIGVGAQGRLSLASWLSVLVGVDAQIETARPVISVEGLGDLRRLGPAALTATVGPEWIL